MARFSYQPTPNPNSIKITRKKGPFLPSGLLAFASHQEAKAHPLASSLFELEGVSNVLILPEFVTVTKNTTAGWRAIWKQIEAILEAYYE